MNSIKGDQMLAINAIFDGSYFKPTEPIPVKGRYEVVITFTKPVRMEDSKRQRILKHFGKWDNKDVKIIEEIVKERKNFSRNRDEI